MANKLLLCKIVALCNRHETLLRCTAFKKSKPQKLDNIKGVFHLKTQRGEGLENKIGGGRCGVRGLEIRKRHAYKAAREVPLYACPGCLATS